MPAVRRVPVILAALALVFTALAFATAPPAGAQAVTVQLLHNNDGESQILTSEEGFGGIARFANLITNLRADAAAEGYDTILVSSGDNYLAGPEFQVGVVDDGFAVLEDPLGRWLPLVSIPIGFFFAWWLARRFAPEVAPILRGAARLGI